MHFSPSARHRIVNQTEHSHLGIPPPAPMIEGVSAGDIALLTSMNLHHVRSLSNLFSLADKRRNST